MNKQLAFAGLTVKAYDDEKREFSGVATTPTPDKVKDVVDPLGAVFTLPLPLLAGHRHDKPIGEVYEARVTKAGIEYKARIPKVLEDGDFKDRVDTAWQEIKYGVVKGVSIGFAAIDYDMLPSGGLHFKRWRWDELSTVAIPAQAEATIAQIKSAYAAEDDGNGAPANPPAAEAAQAPTARAVSTKPVVKLAQAKGKPMSKLQESLKGYEDALAAKKAERTATVMKSLDEGRTADQAEQETIDTLGAEIKELEKQIILVKGMIESDLATAKPIAGDLERKAAPRVDSIKIQANHAEKGLAMAQLVRLHYQAGGNQFALAQIAESQKGSIDPRVVEFAKAAVPAANTGVPAWAGNLVTSGGVYGDFVEYMMPFAIIGKFGRDGRPALRSVPFNVPLIGQLTSGTASWTGEGRAKPLTQWTYGTSMLQPLKIATIAVVTEELLKRASLPADLMIRDELVRALVARMDVDFVNPAKAAVAGISPASVTNGVTPIVSSGNDAVAIRNDIAALMGKFLAANNVPSTGVYLMGTALALQLSMMQNLLGQTEFPGIGMTGGTFMGLPVIVSDYVPAETVILMNASDVYFADEGGIDVSMSREASLEMDSAPTHNSTTPTPAQLVSLWQTNSVAWRVERSLNWAKRRPEAVQVLETVKWGQPTTP